MRCWCRGWLGLDSNGGWGGLGYGRERGRRGAPSIAGRVMGRPILCIPFITRLLVGFVLLLSSACIEYRAGLYPSRGGGRGRFRNGLDYGRGYGLGNRCHFCHGRRGGGDRLRLRGCGGNRPIGLYGRLRLGGCGLNR